MSLSACKHDPVSEGEACDFSGVTYENYIRYVMEDKCLGCHITNSIPPALDSYSNVKSVVDDGRIPKVLTGEPGYPLMPYQSSKLPDCMIANIVSWIEDGTPEQ